MGPKLTKTSQPSQPSSSIQPLEDAISILTKTIMDMQTTFDRRHEELSTVVLDLQTKAANRPSSSTPPPPLPPPKPPASPLSTIHPATPSTAPFRLQPQFSPTTQLKPPKITLPLFDGSSSLEWIFQAEQYFKYYNIGPAQRMKIFAFNMTGNDLGWFQWMYSNHQLFTWEIFV